MGKRKGSIALILICFMSFAVFSLFTSVSCMGKSVNEYDIDNFLIIYNESNNVKKIELASNIAELSGKKAIPFLKDLLFARHDDLKVASIIALGNIRASDELPILRKHLEDPNYLIRIVSAQALLKMGDDTGVGTLSNILKDKESLCSELPLVLDALSLNNSELSIHSLIDFIESDRCINNYEGEALLSLGKIGGAKPVTYLIGYVGKTEKKDVNRTYAIQALGLTDHPVALDFLTILSKKKDELGYNKIIIKKILKGKHIEK